jgi:Leucine-rich repeat (LRR) protein
VLTGYDAADSAHAEDDQDQTVENWAAERDVGPLEDREEALTRLNLSERDQHLDVGSLSLTSLPRFSTDLRQIDVSFNRLTRLPDSLPATLGSLNVGHNQLTNLPALPAVLAYLNASDNRLAGLPEALPPALQFLDVSYNECRSCRRSSLIRSSISRSATIN